MDKYIIKITRKTPEEWRYEGGREEIHYYQGELGRRGKYNTTWDLTYVNKFTKQKAKKIIKEVEWMYKENPDNGTLIKIEVLDSETLELVNMDESKYTKFTRFEIMEI